MGLEDFDEIEEVPKVIEKPIEKIEDAEKRAVNEKHKLDGKIKDRETAVFSRLLGTNKNALMKIPEKTQKTEK